MWEYQDAVNRFELKNQKATSVWHPVPKYAKAGVAGDVLAASKSQVQVCQHLYVTLRYMLHH